MLMIRLRADLVVGADRIVAIEPRPAREWDPEAVDGVSLFIDQYGKVAVPAITVDGMILKLRQSGITIANIFEENDNG